MSEFDKLREEVCGLKTKVGILLILAAFLGFGLVAHVIHDAIAFASIEQHAEAHK